MTGSMIPAAKPIIGDEERAAVDRVLQSGMIAQGPEVKAFEEEFAAHFGLGRECETGDGQQHRHPHAAERPEQGGQGTGDHGQDPQERENAPRAGLDDGPRLDGRRHRVVERHPVQPVTLSRTSKPWSSIDWRKAPTTAPTATIASRRHHGSGRTSAGRSASSGLPEVARHRGGRAVTRVTPTPTAAASR